MSSRVRMIGQHPNYGVVYGAVIRKYIEESWMKKHFAPVETLAPMLYASWPRWKRLMWMAKNEGFWSVKMFREPKHTDIQKSLYGKTMVAYGLGWPKLKRKNKYLVKAKQVDGNVKERLIPAQKPRPIAGEIPVQMDAVREAGRMYGWAGGGLLAQAAPLEYGAGQANLQVAARQYHQVVIGNPYIQYKVGLGGMQNMAIANVPPPPDEQQVNVIPEPDWAIFDDEIPGERG